MTTFGYGRISTAEQSLERQRDELLAAGADEVRTEVASGKRDAKRPVWDELLRNLRSGDVLMVTELSRLGRSTSQLAALADELTERKVSLRNSRTGNRHRYTGRSIGLPNHQRRGRDGTCPTHRTDYLGPGSCPCPWSGWWSAAVADGEAGATGPQSL